MTASYISIENVSNAACSFIDHCDLTVSSVFSLRSLQAIDQKEEKKKKKNGVGKLKTVFVSTVIHTLKYYFTATSGVPYLPKFRITAMVDDVLIGYCGSNVAPQVKQDWMRELLKDEPQHLEWYTWQCQEEEDGVTYNLDSFKRRLNQSDGTVCFLYMINVLLVSFSLMRLNRV